MSDEKKDGRRPRPAPQLATSHRRYDQPSATAGLDHAIAAWRAVTQFTGSTPVKP